MLSQRSNTHLSSLYNLDKRRWWILIMLCAVIIQHANNSFGFAVIQDKTQDAYQWNKSTIQLLTLWSPIWFIPTAISLPYWPHSWSSRSYVTLASALICIASILKAITRYKPYALILAHAAQIINSIAGPFVLSTITLISSEWFPINQRLFATSVAISAHYLGLLISYGTSFIIHQHQHRILMLFRVEALPAIIIFIVILIDQIYFDDLPIVAPSISALLTTETRKTMNMTFKEELYYIMQQKNFHYFVIMIAMFEGLVVGWNSVLDKVLGKDYLGYDDIESIRVINCLITVTMIIGIAALGFIVSQLQKPIYKQCIIGFKVLSGIFLIIFVLSANQCILFPSPIYGVIACSIALSTNAAIYGIIYESSVENIYPARQILASALLTVYINIFGILFIVLAQYITPVFMNWILCVSQFLCAVSLYFYQQKYDRFRLDTAVMRLNINESKSRLSASVANTEYGMSSSFMFCGGQSSVLKGSFDTNNNRKSMASNT